MRVELLYSRLHLIFLVALCVVGVPTLSSASECAQSFAEQRAIWNSNYAAHLGDGEFLDRWKSFPGCWELHATNDDAHLKQIEITEYDERILITSPKSLYLDSSAFGELAHALLRVSQMEKPVLWALDSYGGWLEVTLVLLDLIRGLNTPLQLVITKDSICYSSCLLLAAGVQETFVHPSATFGFHGATLGNEYTAEGTELYLSLLIQMGVNPVLLQLLKDQGVFDSSTFHYMRAAELEGSGLFREYRETI